MATGRSTLQIAKYLHKSRGRSHSIVELGEGSDIQRYIRDYEGDLGEGSFGQVYRMKHESDATKTVLAKLEKPKPNDFFGEGHDMLREALNWLKVEPESETVAFIGDEEVTDEPHIIIMPDKATPTTKPLKKFKYADCNDFLQMSAFILDNVDDFHRETGLVHFDLSVNNLLYDEVERKIKFVDVGLSREIGEEVHKNLYDLSCHSGKHSGYFPPELNPAITPEIDKTAKLSHDTYLAGKLLVEMFNEYALDKNGNKLVFLPAIQKEFLKITKEMQATESERIELDDAYRKMTQLWRLNQVLEQQDSLSAPSSELVEIISLLKQTLVEPEREIIELSRHLKPENRFYFMTVINGQEERVENTPSFKS